MVTETKDEVKTKAREILDNFLEAKNHRKTPERHAILDTIYDLRHHFTLEELGEEMERRNFRVSRATLYNTMRLFLVLRLVTRHRFTKGTYYEACYDKDNHCHQICTICGKVTEIAMPLVMEAIENTPTRRFRKDGFTLYIYGACSACQAKQMRSISAKKKRNQKTTIKK